MKISSSIRELYNLQKDINKSLEIRVKQLFEEGKKDNWFYKGRVKQIESFAQKIETGRFKPDALEDFFACTLVVENRKAIHEAKQLVENFCTIKYQRPKDSTKTHKYPDVFSFDDLRLYVKLKPSEVSPRTPLNDIVFEVQIKTFLQHAWSIATHDLIYKGGSISWSKARLAFQIKAMLEHAEISIEQVEEIAKSTALAVIDPKTQILKEIVSWLEATWPKELLPSDIVRLSQTLSDIMTALKLDLNSLKGAINQDTQAGFGAKSMNLSPYEAIIKAIATHRKNEFSFFLNQNNLRNGAKILITPEMEIEISPSDRIVFAKAESQKGL